MKKKQKGKAEPTQPEETGWPWAAMFVLTLAALLFVTSTIRIMKNERGVAQDLNAIRRQNDKLEKTRKQLENRLTSITQDPQEAQRTVDKYYSKQPRKPDSQ